MATVAQLNAEIGVNIQPLQAGLAAAESAIQGFGQDVASSANVATESLAGLYQALDNLQAAQARLPEGSANFQELGASIQQVTAKIETLEASEQNLTNVQKQLAASATQLTVAEKQAGSATGEFSNSLAQASSSAGAGLTGALGGASKALSVFRTAAYLIPGIGLAGIFNLIFEGIVKVADELNIFGSRAANLDPILEKLKAESQSFQDSLSKVEESALATGVKLQSFVDIARDGQLPLAQRNEALKEANKILGEHGEKLTLVNIYTKAVTDEVNNFTSALIAQAVAAKYADQIADQIIKNKNLLKDYAAAQKNLNDLQSQRFTDGTFSTPYADAIKKVNDIAAEYNQRIGSLTGLYKDLNEETLAAVQGFTEVGTKGKESVDKVGKSLVDLNKDLKALNEDAILNNWSGVATGEAYIKRINQEIEKLIKLGVAADDLKIKDLQVQIQGINAVIDPFAQKEFQKKVNEFVKGQAGQPIPIDITAELETSKLLNTAFELRNESEDTFYKNSKKRLKEHDKDVADSAKKEQQAYKQIADSLSNTIGNIAKSLGEGIGKAIVGKGDPFEALKNSLGAGLEDLGATLIKLGIEAQIVQTTLKSLLATPAGPVILIGAGIAITAIGSAIQNSGVTPHAEGGVFTGPTQIGSHLFGEAGPEFLVGQNRLEALLAKNGNGGKSDRFVTRISGNDIVIVKNRQDRYNNRNFGNFTR